MICKLCKIKEATNFSTKDFGICDSCMIDIQLAFSYGIGGREVTKEEYEERINGRIN